MAADGPNHRGYILGSAATARCRTATSCALSGAHSSTRPVRGELGSAPRPAAGEHERSPMLVTLRSEENVYVLSQPLAQLAACRRLDHDGQAPCTRPERAFSPGSFALAQPTWAGGAAGQLSRRRAAVASAGEVRSSKGCGVGAGAVAARSSTRALASRRPI